ncbi:MAG: sigma-70 family RNA polymerase sigma factor [Hyphomonas sp.]|uniref:sigma-70 family RNA polymerase sigma factor n=1 Tax=Hyphomonas sp. TaxID=87 RepID=UPI0030012713
MSTFEDDNATPLGFADELERLLPELRAFARSLCRNRDLADDLVQETCLNAWAAIDRFQPGAAMRPWLFRILRNEFYQHARRAWRSTELEPEQAERTLVANESLEARSDFRVLQAAIDSLPQTQRDAIVLVVAAGFTYDEAGLICDCSAGTVKSRVSRARDAVMHIMTQAEKGHSTTGGPSELSQATRGLNELLADIKRLSEPPELPINNAA